MRGGRDIKGGENKKGKWDIIRKEMLTGGNKGTGCISGHEKVQGNKRAGAQPIKAHMHEVAMIKPIALSGGLQS